MTAPDAPPRCTDRDPCPCDCHGAGPDVPCSIPGGCGSEYHREVERPNCGARCLRMTEKGLCDRCTYLLNSDLLEVDDLWRMLSLMPGQSEKVRVSGSRDMPIGLRVDVLSFTGPRMDDTRPQRLDVGEPDLQVGALPLLDTLAQWVKLILAETYATPPAGHTLLVPWLLDHDRLGWACRQSWADDMAEEIRTAISHCRALAGAGWLTHRLRGVACPNVECGVCALTRENGAEQVRCVNCWRSWSWDEYRWLVEVLASDAPKERPRLHLRLAPGPAWGQLCPVCDLPLAEGQETTTEASTYVHRVCTIGEVS